RVAWIACMKPTVAGVAGVTASLGAFFGAGFVACAGAWAGACACKEQNEAIAKTASVSEGMRRIRCTLVVGESAPKNTPRRDYNRAACASSARSRRTTREMIWQAPPDAAAALVLAH